MLNLDEEKGRTLEEFAPEFGASVGLIGQAYSPLSARWIAT
jgi:hypothetical protein